MRNLIRLFNFEILTISGFIVIIFQPIGKFFYNGFVHKDLSFIYFFFAVSIFFLTIILPKSRSLAFNIGFLILALGGTEKYLVIKKNKEISYLKVNTPQGFTVHSDALGYAPKKNQAVWFTEYYKDTLLFNVKITIDKRGLRKTSEYPVLSDTRSIVVMGCSFPYGFGLNDNETLPSILQDSLKSKYKVYNFGFEGYGTQQVLANAESRRFDTILEAKPRLFVYPIIEDHINRILGYKFWNAYSNEPRYVLDHKSHEVEIKGRLNESKGLILDKFENSEIAKLMEKKQADTSDVELFVGMVLKTRNVLKKKYPQSDFQIIFWNANTPVCKAMLRGLKKHDLNIALITDIVPDYYENIKKYCIYFPYEVHPNCELNKLLANFIVKKLNPI